jgi:hypothetical protein
MDLFVLYIPLSYALLKVDHFYSTRRHQHMVVIPAWHYCIACINQEVSQVQITFLKVYM